MMHRERLDLFERKHKRHRKIKIGPRLWFCFNCWLILQIE
jgi:hypothetical protein